MTATIGMYLSVVLALAIGWYLAKVWYGRDADGSRAARGAVAAAPERPSARLADIIEDHGALQADMKQLRREWADFERTFERRWGTLTRGMRRDAAAAAADAPTPDPNQVEFPIEMPSRETASGEVASGAGGGRHLRPARLHLKG